MSRSNGKARMRTERCNSDGMAPSGHRISSAVPSTTGNQASAEQSCPLVLSDDDQRHLAGYEKRLQLVRDRVAAVAHGYITGFFLSGPGGISKSYTVTTELKRLQANFRVSNSRMTGRGLFDVLAEYPSATHVLEDVEGLLRDMNGLGVLRSALWGQRRDGDEGPMERWINWDAHGHHLRTLFAGGIIVNSNRPLLGEPELRALKTRIPCDHLSPGDPEIRAMMRSIALRGFSDYAGRKMEPVECWQVCEYLIAESLALHHPLDLRALINSYSAYLQWSEGDAGVHWRDAVGALVRERATVFREAVDVGPRDARKQRELEIVRKILAETSDPELQYKRWKERTADKSISTWYRRKEQFLTSHFSIEK